MNSLEISAYRRIAASGFDIKITQNLKGFRIQLLLGPEIVARATAARMGAVTAAQALERVKNNSFGPASEIYQVLQQLAEISERYSTVGA